MNRVADAAEEPPATRILFVSHTDPYGPFRIGSHHLADALARDGHDVVHLSTPISAVHLITRRVSRAKAAATPVDSVGEAGVRYLVPRTLLPAGIGAFRVTRRLRRLGLRGFDMVLIDQPLLWSRSLLRVAPAVVYRPTDEYPSGMKARLQRDAIRRVDGVIATSRPVLDRLGPLPFPSTVIENGVDTERFHTVDWRPRPEICVYIGAFDSRFDWNQTMAWAGRFPRWRFVLAGPAATPPAALPVNVELLGPVPYESVPRLLAEARIGLLPLSDDPLNRGRSPMKLYEYLASGLSVVSRQTEVVHPDPARGVFTYTDAANAAEALQDAIRHASPNAAGVEHALGQAWTTKARRLLEFVAGVTAR
ncbi:hypothetical protein GCM10010460_23370 [Microbacterium terrae]|uniref:glycosyltransferase n=1 Tax=Microbacterium terrae TaxID=69369 RepID=UPI0005EC977C|nr:glycosyltransferase [Microbacterium terrae]GLJ97781.1 hypothetical protein GCM10017594_09780 [Microbacterium terrae]